ncbi:MAG: SET domain-containing protein [Patescibacteria group bacterium]
MSHSLAKLPHSNVYTRLAPSKINGIGVFAIKDIPKGKDVFVGDNSKIVWIDKKDIRKQSPEIQKMYNDFCIVKGDKYGCPDNFNNLTVGWYLNNSQKPNVRCNKNYDFITLRLIKKGEELAVDYSAYSDDYK